VFVTRFRNRVRYLFRSPFVYKNWWAVPLPKLGVGVVLRLRNGLSYLVRAGTTDLAVVNETWLADPYTAPEFGDLPDDAVVLDVGANIGDFTMKMARACPRGRVVAVEPVGEHSRMIEVQKLLNRADNVTNLAVALGGAEGEVDIHVEGESSSAAWGSGPVERVRQTTLRRLLDELNIDTVSLLKMDCEGAEWDILPAADDVLHRVQRIAMEFHCSGEWTGEKLAAWLRDRGFEVRHTSGAWTGLLWAFRPAVVPQPAGERVPAAEPPVGVP
jgi:FkbM family methyltransferase